jgi:hypothetical protein
MMKALINAAVHNPRSLYGLRPFRRHSLVLLVLGAIYFLIGIAYAFTPTTHDRAMSLHVALQIMPMQCWGLAWMFIGALGMISSRWPIPSEKWGYSVLSGMSALWACFYAWGPFYGAPLGSLSGALSWGGVSFLWWAISGLVNPIPHDTPPVGDERLRKW